MAVLTRTASAPISRASAAWLGAPGRRRQRRDGGLFDDDLDLGRVWIPRLLPMGEPSGMTVRCDVLEALGQDGSALM